MKIAYLLNYPVDKNDGVIKKVKNQICEWEKLGNEVLCWAFSATDSVVDLPLRIVKQGRIKSRIVESREMLESIAIYNPDIVYFRYTYWNPTLARIQKTYSNIVEVNSDDVTELLTVIRNSHHKPMSVISYIINALTRGIVFNRVNGIIAVTNELIRSKRFAKYKKPSCVIPNSIDVHGANFRKSLQKTDRIGLFFIGSSGQNWHGIDLIVKMAKELKEFDFHIVGTEGTNTDNIFYYGYLDTKQYLGILDSCAVCFGTLALFRKSMVEACPLKVREYLAYGYPIIIGYDDTAFLAEIKLPDWVYRMDCQKSLDFEGIRHFVSRNVDTIVQVDEADKFVGSGRWESKRCGFMYNVFKAVVE